ncbi:MAG TPA: DUF5719 family protein [Acidimicrobiales bacterium]|nr:DUF5719 family protein [Acidimicrobiales bacterium]
MSPRSRLVAVIVMAAVVAGALVADRVARPEAEGDTAIAMANLMPTAAPARALSSTWFCAAGTGNQGGAADAGVIVVNPSSEAVTATITVVGTEGEPATVPLDVPASGRASVRLGDVVAAPYVAATVDVPRGEVAVERVVQGPLGASAAPCASFGSQRWYVADGSTAREDAMILALYNPFPEDAIVDLSFSTDEGRAVPSDFQGIVVKGGRVVPVNVGDHVRRRNRVAATVQTRRGRLVVDRLQLRSGEAKGISVALAAPSAGGEWWFADGYVGDGVGERFSIYNPTGREAVASLELILEEGAAEPFDLTIPPLGRIDVVANDEERVPKGVGHSAVVRSLNDVPVVAERSVVAIAPSGRSGTSEIVGGRRAASRWLFAAGGATDVVDEWITVVNPGASPVQVSLTALAAGQPLAIEGLQDLELGPGRRRALRLTDHIKREDLPLLVEASGGEIIVERAIYLVGTAGISFSTGVPMR